jgi:regulatory protein YycH of two-component signal transduction system YycFG
MKKTTLVAIILGVLVLVSVVQAFQLNSLKEKVAEGQLSIGSSSGKTTPQTSSGDSGKRAAALPSSIRNLPQMVGGC